MLDTLRNMNWHERFTGRSLEYRLPPKGSFAVIPCKVCASPWSMAEGGFIRLKRKADGLLISQNVDEKWESGCGSQAFDDIQYALHTSQETDKACRVVKMLQHKAIPVNPLDSLSGVCEVSKGQLQNTKSLSCFHTSGKEHGG